MRQTTFAEGTFERYRKPTRREQFLAQMDLVIPWQELVSEVAPHYPQGDRGRPPVGIERMLRIYFVQQWYNLSDPAVEDALYDSAALRGFVGIDLGNEPAPDETTICKFRHLLERHDLGKRMFRRVNKYLQGQGFKVSGGTIVDATIINAPSSTKNREGKRDPDMSPSRKGNQWFFGMKGHIGVDSKTGLIHSAAASTASIHDSQLLPALMHGKETRLYGDKGYANQRELIRVRSPNAKDFTLRKSSSKKSLTEREAAANRHKSKVRSKVEHPFLVIKRIFGFAKVRYRGIDKNSNRFFALCALTNLYLVRNQLVAT